MPETSQPENASAGRDGLYGLLLALAVFLTYLPVWHAGFIWDDDQLVTANPVIVGPLGLKAIWTTSAADICPLTLTTFWIEHALWGTHPLPYHLVNVLLHAACAVTLWQVLRQLQVPGAWLGAALWALHPVEVESVAWISEMKNTQSGLFFLLAILFYVRSLATNRREENRDYALTLIFAALAMASKSSTVILPLVLGLCAWWMKSGSARNLSRLAPLFLMSITAGLLSLWTQSLNLENASASQWARSWPERVAAAGDAVWFYLGKILWPHPLITVYPRWEIDATQWISWLPLLAVIVVLFVLWLKCGSWARPWFFAFAWFLLTLLPVLGLLDNPLFRYSLVFDHLQYLAGMGPLALAGAGLAALASRAILPKPVTSALAAALLLVLAACSWQRSRAYANEETLWTDTLAKNPACWVGYNNLGIVLSGKGQFDEAISRFHEALQIDPNYANAHNGLGIALSQKGDTTTATAEFEKALDIDPNYAEAHYNLGNIYLRAQQLDSAATEFRKTLHQKPYFAQAHSNLGAVLFEQGHFAAAVQEFQATLLLRPNDPKAQANLAKAQSMAHQSATPNK